MPPRPPGSAGARSSAGPRRRVVITGLGAVTPLGSGRDGLWGGLRRAHSAVRLLTRFDARPFKSQVAAQVDDFDPLLLIEPRTVRRLDRYSQFAVVAALQAVADAGLALTAADQEQAGVYLGSALGGLSFAEEQHARFVAAGIRAVDPILALSVFGAAASANVAMILGLHGPNMTNANSCASGALAIGQACELIRQGGAPLMLAGGAEAPLAPLTFGSFALINALSSYNDTPETASRPFDRTRNGFVMAEGAAMLVLEDAAHARARGAHIYAEICGYATSTDAFHMTAPLPSGAQTARVMQEALDDAGIAPAQVGYLNAHGSGTPLGDRAEALAIRAVFGPALAAVPMSGTKALHGHALGATGAIEAAICALCLEQGWLPPAVNIQTPDPDCDLPFIAAPGLERRVDYILSNSFGFGGLNVGLVFARYRP
ncbi:MAG TPA: beta-ketoacyl-[acyl-carrier-protein] synthase family protein [Chloroflexia bacterium]|nr:beta-ketoacyl-[acyl-carrier-protein] synthase family protein [Chloroflexia bacterium]